MEMRPELKLDSDLADLITQDFLDPSATVPVVIKAAESRLQQVIELVRGIGELRHVLRRFDAVSAWIPLGRVKELVEADIVEEVELDQVSYIA